MAYAIKAPARYVQGPGELDNLGLNTKKIGTKFFTIVSASGQKRFGDRITASLAQEEHTAEFSIFHGEATKEEVAGKDSKNAALWAAMQSSAPAAVRSWTRQRRLQMDWICPA